MTFDTNVLIYSIDKRVLAKHLVARRVVKACSLARSPVALQCLQEFFYAATRKGLVSLDQATLAVNEVRVGMDVVPASEPDLVEAMSASERQGIQFFDALMLATVNRAGCRVFFSEDMQHERVYDGVRVVSPFRLEERALGELLVDTA